MKPILPCLCPQMHAYVDVYYICVYIYMYIHTGMFTHLFYVYIYIYNIYIYIYIYLFIYLFILALPGGIGHRPRRGLAGPTQLPGAGPVAEPRLEAPALVPNGFTVKEIQV